MSKVTYKISLSDFVDTKSVSRSAKTEIKKRMSNYLLDQVLEDVSKQLSSVSGKKWKGLTSEQYKKIKAKVSSSKSANLELYGDMLDALKVKNTQDGIEYGIFNTKQAKKADGHCHTGVFGKSKLPKRQFIPSEDEKLRRGILNDLKDIVSEVVAEESTDKRPDSSLSDLLNASLLAKAKSDGSKDD